jgi:hypothetical protein
MTHKQARKVDERDYMLLLIATLPLFFVAVVIKRALPWNWGSDKRSVFAATRSAALDTIPYAFM